MEKIKVNMSPNPLDIQTIHCSQGDTEAREWGFELHNNGDVIDSSEITDQIVFKAYKGGTEELLPSGLLNGSVDLGSLSWNYTSSTQVFTSGAIPERAFTVNGFCPNYETINDWNTFLTSDKSILFPANATIIRIKDSNYTDANAFKQAMNGVYAWFEKSDSTPTTSPFDGTIKYPSGSVDSYFTYRESPTEEDGLAKITDIKGNTLVWNQLVQNGNFADTSIWSTTGTSSSFTVSNNIATVTAGGAYDRIQQNVQFISGHKYLIKADVKKTNANDDIRLYYGIHLGAGSYAFANTTEWQTLSVIRTASESVTSVYPNVEGTTSNLTWQQRNMMIFDLTQMGLNISNPSGFTSLFSLPYYAYNQGTLLSFMGNGIKTTGKNEANIPFEQGAVSQTVNFSYQASKVSSATRIRCESLVVAEKNKIYKCDWNTSIYDCVVQAYDENRLSTGTSDNPFNTWFTVPFTFTGTGYVAIAFKRKDGTNITPSEIDAIRPNLYLADTETITNLPISTYFPNGMKSAGSVYDELTPTKAITRLKKVTYSSSTGWTTRTTGSGWNIFEITPSDIKHVGTPPNETIKNNRFNWNRSLTDNNTIRQVNQIISVRKDDITSLSDWNAYLASNPLEVIYELATPTETSITTASLVTENAEIPLSNEDGVLIGKCTEQLSSESGFIDAKIKLADEDGDVYSNKIQLHVERSPQ